MSASERRGPASSAKSPAKTAAPGESEPAPRRAWLAVGAAWLIPGLGHFVLGRRGRGVLFAIFVFCSVAIGSQLHGQLYVLVPEQPFSVLGTVASMGMGLPYFILRWGLGYEGVVTDLGYDYGKAFLLTAGLMNCLLVLDAWDIACGRKE